MKNAAGRITECDAPERVRPSTPEYIAGKKAFLRGEPAGSNPHFPQSGNSIERIHWFRGWYDAKYAAFLENWEAKRKVRQPLGA